jgi:hypothetical protein
MKDMTMKHLILTIPAAAVLTFLWLAGASDTHAKNVMSCITAGCTKSAHAVPFPGEKGSPIALKPREAEDDSAYRKAKRSKRQPMNEAEYQKLTNNALQEAAAGINYLFQPSLQDKPTQTALVQGDRP